MITYRISDDVLKKYNHGDGAKISRQTTITKSTINRAIREKRAIKHIFDAINNFYNKC